MANNPRQVSRRTDANAQAMYNDPTPRSPFSDDDDYVVISRNSYDDTPGFRPSMGSSSDHHYSGANPVRLSQDPLLQPSERYEQQQPGSDTERRLLTLNELNPVERAALVRQSRKLNKILGTTPHIAENSPTLSPRNAPNKLQRRGTLAGSDIRFDRSATMAALNSPPLEPPAGSQWGKTATSLVASAATNSNAPVLLLNVAPSSGEVVDVKRARRLSDSSVTSSLASFNTGPRRSGSNRLVVKRQTTNDSLEDGQVLILPAAPDASKSRVANSGIYIPPSPTSPPYISDSVRRQQTRARMAKLQQIMGESVPSELVMGANADTTRRRRLSMESPTTPVSASTKALKHKRSKTFWRKDFNEPAGFDSAPENSGKGHSKAKSREMPPIEDLLRNQLQIPMDEKQKALNVKRALKMAAVFGVPPPQVLYQDIPTPKSASSFDPSMSRQSLASLAYMLDHDRDSLYDLLASTADSDSSGEDEPVDWPYERKNRSDSLPEARTKASTSAVTATLGNAKYTIAGRYPDMAPPTPPFGGHAARASQENEKATIHKPSKSTSSASPPVPTYSTTVSTPSGADEGNRVKRHSSATKSKSSPHAADQQFVARRRRAKKLSRFFGVGYNDLFNTLVYEDGLNEQFDQGAESPPPPLPQASFPRSGVDPPGRSDSLSPHRLPSAAPSSYRGTGRGGTVMVQTDSGKAPTVLRTSANLAADVDAADLGEMMARLRALRA
ncbi:hypothetical protein M408DRAFT_327389 [Serendipita vermifera MAFF 305830]|uniref:Uncharacterized protein n=1 Tax=Serendipita vermifera MAFF 305830 TaxID=933852 RepID=A0A0C2X187_SERVB|nr:hypothetical protein M408DRAFT_327389 [Serendipita vermifera MAFF 305830]